MQLRLTPWIRSLLVVFGLVYVITHFLGTRLPMETLSWSPSRFIQTWDFWTILSFGLVHADAFHLFFNGLMLVMIGAELELRFGGKTLLMLWFFGQLSAAMIAFLAFVFMRGSSFVLVGSSAGMYAILWVYVKIFSERKFLFLFFFEVPALVFVGLVVAIETLSLANSSTFLSGLAHLSGFGAGAIFWWWKARAPRPKKRAKHLSLVVNKRDPKYWN